LRRKNQLGLVTRVLSRRGRRIKCSKYGASVRIHRIMAKSISSFLSGDPQEGVELVSPDMSLQRLGLHLEEAWHLDSVVLEACKILEGQH
jgi:hypothetical protein